MTRNTIGNSIHEYRSLSCQKQFLLAGNSIGHCQRIVTVNSLCMHVVGINASTNSCQQLVSHGFTTGLSTHSVEVIEEVEQDWRSSSYILWPQCLVLVHSCHHHGFPYRTATKGCVTYVGNNNTRLSVDSLEQGCTSGNICRTTYDGVIGHRTEGQEVCVHRTT